MLFCWLHGCLSVKDTTMQSIIFVQIPLTKAGRARKMYGAIIGDIVGSKYEFNNIKTKNFPLFSDGCDYTDDTIMTMAVAKALVIGFGVKNHQGETSFQDD